VAFLFKQETGLRNEMRPRIVEEDGTNYPGRGSEPTLNTEGYVKNV